MDMDAAMARIAADAAAELEAIRAAGGHEDPLQRIFGLAGWRDEAGRLHLGTPPGAEGVTACLCAVHVRADGAAELVDHADAEMVARAARLLEDLDPDMAEWFFGQWPDAEAELVLPPAKHGRDPRHGELLRRAAQTRLVAIVADARSCRVRLSAPARFAFALGLADAPRARVQAMDPSDIFPGSP